MDPAAGDPLARAARLCADPAGTIRRFRALTGRRSVGLFPPCIPPEVVEAAGMLPVSFFAGGRGDGGAVPAEVISAVDAFALPLRGAAGPGAAEALLELVGEGRPVFRFAIPGDHGRGMVEDLLDAVEAFIEWASAISGSAVNEGELHRAIRAANRRKRLWGRLSATIAESPGAFSAGELLALARSGAFLPAEAHSGILGAALARRSGARGGRRVFVAGVPSEAAMAAVDAAGAVVCGSELSEEAALRAEAVAEAGDAALCIARNVARGTGPAEGGREPWADPERLARAAGACGAGAIVVLGANGGPGGVEAGKTPVFRIRGAARADEECARLREFLEGLVPGERR